MSGSPSGAGQPRVPPVDPALFGSALFLFQEYLARLEAQPEEEEPEIDTRAVLDLFAEELGTGVQTTLTLYLRVTALYRLLARSPDLAELATEAGETAGALSETALLAASRLDLRVSRAGAGEDGAADFDPREFRAALLRVGGT